jgi:ribosomal protein L18E
MQMTEKTIKASGGATVRLDDLFKPKPKDK